MNVHVTVEVQLQAFCTTALVGGGWSVLRSDAFTSGERMAVTDSIGSCVGSRHALEMGMPLDFVGNTPHSWIAVPTELFQPYQLCA
jgi:hypothetical protein